MTVHSPAEREARRTALILAATQAIVGSAAVVAISLGALAGQYLSTLTSRWRRPRSPASM